MNTLTIFAVATIVYTTLAMWATQASSSCVMPQEPSNQLYLDRQTDYEHLERDARRIRQVSRRTASSEAGINECRDSLAHQVATMHRVHPDSVRAAIDRAH